MLVWAIQHASARATRRAYSIPLSLTTGRTPGIPEQIGHTATLGSAAVGSTTGQAQNIFDFVSSSAWTSRPMTASYFMGYSKAPGRYLPGLRARFDVPFVGALQVTELEDSIVRSLYQEAIAVGAAPALQHSRHRQARP